MKLSKIILEKNRKFVKANKQRRRVLIAQDVIELVNSKKLTPSHTGWHNTWEIFGQDSNKQLQSALITSKVSCQCCALGALFLTDVLYRDACTIKDAAYCGFSKITDRLEKYFIFDQLRAIEVAYERGFGRCSAYGGYEHYSDFGKRFEHSTDRLIAIMQNIIDNKGTFIP